MINIKSIGLLGSPLNFNIFYRLTNLTILPYNCTHDSFDTKDLLLINCILSFLEDQKFHFPYFSSR